MSLLVFVVGCFAAGCIAALAHWVRFDRDRSFYPTILILIASYYILFAVTADASGSVILIETVLAMIFVGLALIGALRFSVLIGIGLLLHGILDWFHPLLVANPGVPGWWPMFCAGFDVALGIWVLKWLSGLPEH